MDSHRHQHLLETISKQPLRDTTLIFCTIDVFASCIIFLTDTGLQLVPHTTVCSICYDASQTLHYLSALCNFSYLDHSGYHRPHRAASCGLLLTHLRLATHERESLPSPLPPKAHGRCVVTFHSTANERHFHSVVVKISLLIQNNSIYFPLLSLEPSRWKK